MDLDRIIAILLGAGFGARALDSKKSALARIGYGLVGFDLLKEGIAGSGTLFGPVGQQSTGLTKRARGDSPPGKLNFEERRVKTIAERVAYVHEQMVKGTRDPEVYALAREVLTRRAPNGDWAVSEKDYVGEMTALFNEARSRCRYTMDPVDYDAFQTPKKTLQLASGDCVPATALVITSGFKLTPIGEVAEGDSVMGSKGWTKVTKFWEKGTKSTLNIHLDNGSTLVCTKNHRLFLENGVEVRAEKLKVGQLLKGPGKLPIGQESMDPDRAWLLGTYIADGWGEKYRCAIAGKDGHPKEAQKHRVESICSALGIATRWHERYIAINDPELSRWLGASGHGAKAKHIPSLNLDEQTLRTVVDGIKADSAITEYGTVTFGTISEQLALQLRIAYRMLGQSTHVRRVDDHGGLGKNPIYRITVRKPGDAIRCKQNPKVTAIEAGRMEHVVDIETESHDFYLPESDVIVHNCDDENSLLGAMLRTVGIQVRSRIVQTTGNTTWNHIFLQGQNPTDGTWMTLDLAAIGKPAGWEIPKQFIIRQRDFDVLEKEVPRLQAMMGVP